MKTAIGRALSAGAAFGFALVGCAGRQATLGRGDAKHDLVTPFTQAMEADELRGADAATKAYLALLERALANSAAPHALEAIVTSTDALVGQSAPTLDRVGEDHGLAYRSPGGAKLVAERMNDLYAIAAAAGPFARPAIADAALELALHEGNAALAHTWRERTGCARSATVIGPLDWAPITAVARATPVEDPQEPLASTYRGVGPFIDTVAPLVASADGCDIGLMGRSALEGLRAVVVDVDVPRAMTIGVAIETPSSAALVIGGKPALVRGYELGGGRVEKRATADVGAGRVRVVARVGVNGEGSRLQLRLLADDGAPLATTAPKPGDSAKVAATRASELTFQAERVTDAERALVATALLADGDARTAEHLLEPFARSKTASPATALLYARSIEEAGDLPENRAIERERDALETALKTWPSAWEAVLGHAQLTARRKGTAEGRLEALQEIARARADHPALDPVVKAYEAVTASEGRLFDVSEASFLALSKPMEGTAFLAEVDDAVHDRVGAEREQHACRAPGIDRSTLDCFNAKVARGDHRGALSEVARLRALRDSPGALRGHELSQFVALADEAGMQRVYDAMLPAERTVSALGLLLPRSPSELRSRLMNDLLTAADVPGSLPALSTGLLDSPAGALEIQGSALVAADRKNRSLSNAATAVLKHAERYVIGQGGLLRYSLYDLRRVSGTTDVEQGAQAGGALVEGRDVRRILRRRIHKPDGRVLEPDKASFASQEHSDLSQLERGDYIEQIIEGWALPGASGQLVVDTPDLLPERTSVEDASIELRRPASLDLAVWSHALWGKPTERLDGSQKVTTFSVKARPPRRLEEGVPKMDRDVAVSFGTASWKLIGRSIAEATAALEDRDPFVSEWAKKAAGGAATPRAAVEAIALAAGKSVKVASGAVLSDSSGAFASGAQVTTARTTLELGQGSRTWLAHRSLRELGIPSEIVVAEREPFSADPHFPPHFGRFDYPLVLVHLKEGDLWLDLDVQGPPLPAGRVSPELRGRKAMTAKAEMIAVGGFSADEARDEIDLRLKVDAKGNAAGTFTILLRGRTAQSLADALEKVVGSDRNEMLRGVVLGWVPWANVDDVGLSSTEGSWQVSLRAAVSIPGYAESEGSTWVLPGFEPLHAGFPRPFVSTLGATFASQGARESALAIDDAFQYHVHRRVEVPKGSKIVGVLPTVEVKDDNLEAWRRGKLENDALDEDFGLSIQTGTLDTEHYERFADKAHKVDDGFQAATRIGAENAAAVAKKASARPAPSKKTSR
ncbi:MAG TPA: hypothetical protein VJT73_12795 [Polyangiaceae bacterium]|nr:hypothetical protein [Polyangiaceae bacterium]